MLKSFIWIGYRYMTDPDHKFLSISQLKCMRIRTQGIEIYADPDPRLICNKKLVLFT